MRGREFAHYPRIPGNSIFRGRGVGGLPVSEIRGVPAGEDCGESGEKKQGGVFLWFFSSGEVFF